MLSLRGTDFYSACGYNFLHESPAPNEGNNESCTSYYSVTLSTEKAIDFILSLYDGALDTATIPDMATLFTTFGPMPANSSLAASGISMGKNLYLAHSTKDFAHLIREGLRDGSNVQITAVAHLYFASDDNALPEQGHDGSLDFSRRFANQNLERSQIFFMVNSRKFGNNTYVYRVTGDVGSQWLGYLPAP